MIYKNCKNHFVICYHIIILHRNAKPKMKRYVVLSLILQVLIATNQRNFNTKCKLNVDNNHYNNKVYNLSKNIHTEYKSFYKPCSTSMTANIGQSMEKEKLQKNSFNPSKQRVLVNKCNSCLHSERINQPTEPYHNTSNISNINIDTMACNCNATLNYNSCNLKFKTNPLIPINNHNEASSFNHVINTQNQNPPINVFNTLENNRQHLIKNFYAILQSIKFVKIKPENFAETFATPAICSFLPKDNNLQFELHDIT